VHCGSGFRAAVAASWLAARGHDVVHVDAEWDDAGTAGLDLEEG
jgi:rhodanese-related sulfurtransferase